MDAGNVAHATTRLFDILLQEDAPETILDSLAQIVGETLEVDRSLIYDISFVRDDAECLTEWLNPSRPEISSTRATYPLAAFRSAVDLAFATHGVITSDASAPHPAMIADGSSEVLHGAMRIASLLWYPFAFRDDGFYILAFNHVTAPHAWAAAELEFMRSATRHVTMALVKINLIRERAHAEETLYAAQRLESLGTLAGGIAHDFNNLMVGVVSNAELLRRRLPQDTPVRDLVAQIMRSGQSASALATQLLAFAGKGQPGVTTIDLAQVLRGTLELVRSSLGGAPIDVTTATAYVECSVSQLEQVIMNLLVNAGEAMAERPGRIQLVVDVAELDDHAPYATPTRPPAGRYARLTVTDQGSGMDAALVKRIFDPFFSTKRAGRGLGLSAVLGILRIHHAAIQIDSTPEVGTTFQVVWPLVTPPDLGAPPPPPLRPMSGTPRRLLCIDDDDVVVRAIAQVLGAAGYDVVVATSGTLGLAAFTDGAANIDGVILDLTMPAPGGREVLRYLRRLRPQLPVVLISGFTDDDTIQEGIDPITKFVRKPFLADELSAAVHQLLDAAVE
ncbi:MAG: response regulator [Proteobacteria bacterium]|nr:response regulator [Pseudomonadota bacterium]